MPEQLNKTSSPFTIGVKSAAFKAVAAISYGTGLTRALTHLCSIPRPRFESRSSSQQSSRQLGTFQVLIYHRVHPDDPNFSMDTISPTSFERQIKFLSRNYAVLPLEEIVALRRSSAPLPRTCIAITFDDGYKDNYIHAYPILAKYQLPATVFLTADYIGTDRLLWFDKVLQAFKHTLKKAFRIPWMEGQFVLDTPGSRRLAAHAVLAHLKAQDDVVRHQRIQQILEELKVDPEGLGLQMMLSWSDVRHMLQGRIAVGSHTATHPILSRVSLEDARREITSSKSVLERETGQKVTLFAYPNGQRADFTDETVNLVRQAGYEAAFTTLLKNNKPKEDIFQLGRYRPWESYLPSFALRLAYFRAML